LTGLERSTISILKRETTLLNPAKFQNSSYNFHFDITIKKNNKGQGGKKLLFSSQTISGFFHKEKDR